MNRIMILVLILTLGGCSVNEKDISGDNQKINTMLDEWHGSAAAADYDSFFASFTDNAVYIGTDATENWTKKEFMVWAKPYFDRGRAWSFSALERNIYFGESGTVAWFDELLDTQMKICRGSGVLVKIEGEWKIQHYVLSMTIPNEVTDQVVAAKQPIEDQLISDFRK